MHMYLYGNTALYILIAETLVFLNLHSNLEFSKLFKDQYNYETQGSIVMKVSEMNKESLLNSNLNHIRNEEELSTALDGKLGFLFKNSIVTINGFDHPGGNWIFDQLKSTNSE